MTTDPSASAWIDRLLGTSIDDPLERWHARTHVALSVFLLVGLGAFCGLELTLRGPQDLRFIVPAVSFLIVVGSLVLSATTPAWRWASWMIFVAMLAMLIVLDLFGTVNDSAIAIALATWLIATGFVQGHRAIVFSAPLAAGTVALPRVITEGAFTTDELASTGGAILGIAVLSGTIWAAERSRRQAQVTALQRAQDAERAMEETRHLAEAKSQFLATMSHEIRTPMNGVVNLARLLQDTPLNQDQTHLVRTLGLSSQALLAVLNDVLDFSKIEAGQLSLEEVPVDLRELASSVVDLLQPGADDKGIDLYVNVEADVPEAVAGDPTRLRQLLTNLVSNAIKFTSEGEVAVRLGTLHGGGVRLTVRDTGIGIAADALPDLFDAFTQADASTTRQFGGTGLGLAICKRLVDVMGGELTCESQQGVGSTFTADLPLREIRSQLSDTPEGGPITLTGVRVLVAEDNSVNQLVIERLLLRMGVEVVLVADGRAAVDAVREQAFDLVLMDLHMPVLDGLNATREIRALPEPAGSTPVVALTASALAADRARCLAAGMVDHLGKPIDPRALADVLRSAALAEGAVSPG